MKRIHQYSCGEQARDRIRPCLQPQAAYKSLCINLSFRAKSVLYTRVVLEDERVSFETGVPGMR